MLMNEMLGMRNSHGLSVIAMLLAILIPVESCKQSDGNNQHVRAHCDWVPGEKSLMVTIERRTSHCSGLFEKYV